MARYLHSRVAQDEAVTAGGTVMTHDLPVNPLSLILYTLRARTTAANTLSTLANLLGVMTRVEVIFKGQSIVSASLADLYAVAYYLARIAPHRKRQSDAAAAARIGITVPILFGRKPYDPAECFPAARRGELQLQSTPAAAFTALDTVTLQVETVELLEAQPQRFAKYTTITKTPTATGEHDVDLPIGNPIAGVTLFGTTVPVDGADTASFGDLRLLVDNVEQYQAFTNWESLKGHEALFRPSDWEGSEHVHRLAAGAPAGDALVEAAQWPTAFLRNYAFLDYDPMKDGGYLLETDGRSRVHLRVTADVADAIRVLPIELLAVAGATGP